MHYIDTILNANHIAPAENFKKYTVNLLKHKTF